MCVYVCVHVFKAGIGWVNYLKMLKKVKQYGLFLLTPESVVKSVPLVT